MSTESGSAARHWHQALAYAVLGQRVPELDEQQTPDVEVLADLLRRRADFTQDLASARDLEMWPVPVPSDLMAGLGWAQFAAVLRALIDRLGLADPPTPRPVTGPGRPNADDRRLLDEVPPHHVG